MKNIRSIYLLVLLLSCFTFSAQAGFLVRKSAVVATDHYSAAPATNTVNEGGSRYSLRSRIRSRLFPLYDRYRHMGSSREARLSLWFGLWGLLFAPLGILAIIYGIKALRGRGRDKDMAIIGIVLGSLEVLFMIWFIAFFLSFPHVYYVY